MDNSISMTRVQPLPTATVEMAPRQPAASPPVVQDSRPQPPPATAPASPPAQGQVELEQADLEALLERVGEQISEFSAQSGRELEFQVQNDSSRVVILVKNSATGDVVRAIPPEEVQRLADAIQSGEPAFLDLRA